MYKWCDNVHKYILKADVLTFGWFAYHRDSCIDQFISEHIRHWRRQLKGTLHDLIKIARTFGWKLRGDRFLGKRPINDIK